MDPEYVDREVRHLHDKMMIRLEAMDRALRLQAGKDRDHFQALNNAEERAAKLAETVVARRDFEDYKEAQRSRITSLEQRSLMAVISLLLGVLGWVAGGVMFWIVRQ